jgi:phosphoglycolate phosphatase-like HAD superfamily hydrolase
VGAAAGSGSARAVAVDLDAVLGDTRPLWVAWLEDASRRYRSIAPLDPDALPADRAAAAADLDRWAADGIGDWRSALGRFAEDHAPVYLRPRAAVGTSVRRLAATGAAVGVFTDAPEPLAKVALAHLGVGRRVAALETGAGALARLSERLGGRPLVIRSPADLARAAA